VSALCQQVRAELHKRGQREITLSKPDYEEIVKQAEGAVASIKDADLKAIAFGKVLDTLLSPGGNPKPRDSGTRSNSPGGRKKRPADTAPAKKRGGPKGYVEELIEEDFFETPKTLAAIRAELGNRGHHIPVTSLSRPMMLLCQERRLRRQKAKDGEKQVFTYSNW
jgi:hypothetical protein